MGISWLDLVVLVYLLMHLLTGFQQGLFLGGFGFLALMGSLGLGVGIAPAIATHLGGAPVVDALVVAAICFAALKAAQGHMVHTVGPWLSAHPRVTRWDRWLGLLPGLAWGGLGAGLLTWFVSAVAGGLPAGSPLASGVLATVQAPLVALGQAVSVEPPARARVP